MCQHPNSLAYVAGAPAHQQRVREDDPWVKMDPGFSIRRLIEPMRLIAEQCAVPPQNLVRAGRTALRNQPGTAWTDQEHAVSHSMGRAEHCEPMVQSVNSFQAVLSALCDCAFCNLRGMQAYLSESWPGYTESV